MRVNFSNFLLTIASLFQCASKMVRTKKLFIVVDTLTLPGWFIVDHHLIKTTKIKGKLIGVEWSTHLMPDSWVRDMNRMACHKKIRKLNKLKKIAKTEKAKNDIDKRIGKIKKEFNVKFKRVRAK